MTAITFLHGATNRLLAMAAWLAAENNQQRRPVLVYAPNATQGDQLDKLLWTHSATAFVPHCRIGDAVAGETPIIIAQDLNHPAHDGCLLNLSNEVPPHFSQFHDLIEILSLDDEDKLPGRDRFRFYRDRGYPLESRDISHGV